MVVYNLSSYMNFNNHLFFSYGTKISQSLLLKSLMSSPNSIHQIITNHNSNAHKVKDHTSQIHQIDMCSDTIYNTSGPNTTNLTIFWSYNTLSQKVKLKLLVISDLTFIWNLTIVYFFPCETGVSHSSLCLLSLFYSTNTIQHIFSWIT